MKIAGIAGGVGTTVLATVLDAEDIGRDVTHADVIVARNDYRCAQALVESARADQLVVLIIEPLRALDERDFTNVLGRSVITIDLDPAIARADDAGLLTIGHRSVGRLLRDLRSTGLVLQ